MAEKESISEPSWFKEQVLEQLKIYPKVQRLQDFKEVYEGYYNGHIAIIQIDGRKVSIRRVNDAPLNPSGRQARTIDLIRRVCSYYPYMKMPLLLDTTDAVNAHSKYPHVPILGFCKKYTARGILIPDNPISGTYKLMHNASKRVAWKEKIPKAYFAGANTGAKVIDATYAHNARARLVMLSQENPEFIDAKFTYFMSHSFEDESLADGYFARFKLHPKDPQTDIVKYKYAVDVDGNSNGWTRSMAILSSNTLSMKQNSPFYQWYYRELKEGKHYIPIKEDWSDLIEQVKWAEANPKESLKIIENAQQFARDYFKTSTQMLYLQRVLLEYSNYFQFI